MHRGGKNGFFDQLIRYAVHYSKKARRDGLRGTGRSVGGRERELTPQYGLLRAATGVSVLGDGLAAGAVPLLAHALTNHAFLIGMTRFLLQVPAVFGLWIGANSDRHDARSTMVVSDLARGVLLLAFGLALLFAHPPLLALFATALALGLFNIVFFTAAQQATPVILPNHLLARGNGQIEALRSAHGEFVGPPIGASLFGVSRSVPFLGDAATFFGSAVLLGRLKPIPPQPKPKRRLREEVREGARFALRQPALRTTILFVAATAFCQSMVFAIQVLYFKDLLGYSDAQYGIAYAVAGIGNVVGSLLAERVIGRFGAGASLFVAALMAALTYASISAHLAGWLVILIFVVEATFLGFGLVANLTIRQLKTPTEYRGRVSGFARTVIYSSSAIGALAGGAVADATTVRTACLVAGLLGVAAALAFAPSIRRNLSKAKLATPLMV